MNINLKNSKLSIIPILIVTIVLIINYIENPKNYFILPFIFICAIATVVTTLLAFKKDKTNELLKLYDKALYMFYIIFLIMADVYCLIHMNFILLAFSGIFWYVLIFKLKTKINKKKQAEIKEKVFK